ARGRRTPPAGPDGCRAVSGTLEQLPRLLALVPYLLARPGVPFATAAADFGVTEERLRKDLNLLWLCGLPGHYPRDLIEIEIEGDDEVLPVVREALERKRALHLRYWTAGRDETTERDVDPIRLVTADGQAYLEAWCRRAEGVRMFHLGRVQEVRVLDEPSAPPADVPSRDLSQGLFQPGELDTVVTLALEPGAAWVSDYYPCDSVEDLGDGRQL